MELGDGCGLCHVPFTMGHTDTLNGVMSVVYKLTLF